MSYIVAATEAVTRDAAPGPARSSSRARPIRAPRARSCCPRWRAPGSRSARTSSSPSAPSAWIRATRRTTRRTRRRWSAASRPPAPRWRRRSTSRASTRWSRCRRTEAAELVKLLENTFRTVNIGLVNEMAHRLRQARRGRVGGDRRGRDQAVRLHEVHARARASAATASRSIRTTSRGRCATLNYKTRFIDLAGEINTEMPRVRGATRCADALNDDAQGGERQPRSSCSASRTRRTSTTCARARRSTSSGCSRSRAPRSSYHDPYVPDVPARTGTT